MIARRPVLMGLGATLLAGPGCSRAKETPLTAQMLEDERRGSGSPALAAAAVKKGHAPKKWATGERQAGSGVAVTAQDVWHLGSITKSMTGTLVARLAEQGAIRWEDTAGELLKDVAPDMQDAYRSASFRHLLSHRAGLPKDIPLDLLLTYSRDAINVREDRRSYAREALRMVPLGAKESAFSYSNNGYVVAGAMLEAKLDKTWEELVSAHVFEPLRLTSAGFGAPGEKGKLTQPAGHLFRNDRLVGLPPGSPFTDNPYALGPGGRVHMGLDDVLTYLSAHRDATAFLKRHSWRILHTPPFGGDYAMGWMIRPDGALGHSGSNTLWYAEVLFDRNEGVSAVAATNEGRPEVSRLISSTLLRAAAAAGQ